MEMDGNKSERVVIFIDGSNFYHSAKDILDLQHEGDMDFGILVEKLRSGRLLVGVYYYNAPLDKDHNEGVYWKQQKFFANLRRIPGFSVILTHMRKIRNSGGTFEYAVKGDDIHLAIDMVSLAYENQYDTAILVSGDGDFAPAVRRIRKLGKKAENAYFSVSRSDLLKQVCNKSLPLDEMIEDCVKKDN